ncbi:hypothetical protein [Ruminococcus sp. NK3A76]|uniref:hypothetical protein n=1 Tax=Ruminococcus sp. NK3A76 TaxID=877411 RepID=UPI00048FF859|nr:hypothetical protein [Ruminococcus sp. NK3A76]
MKRYSITALLVVMIAMLTGCIWDTPDVEGGELIKKAREAYTSLDSARVVMTNTETGECEQEFIFKYDEKGILTYSYKGKSEKSSYAQFNNGLESYTEENGKVTHLVRGDKDFAAYSKDAKHPQADMGLIIYQPASVKTATVTDESGETHIHHEYDLDKISPELEEGEATAFYADYYFKDDELLYFTETTEVKIDGKEKKYQYKVEIMDKNKVERVENPIKID